MTTFLFETSDGCVAFFFLFAFPGFGLRRSLIVLLTTPVIPKEYHGNDLATQ